MQNIKEKDATARLREIPSVDELLGRARLVALSEQVGRPVVTQAVRAALADLRARLKAAGNTAPDGAASSAEAIEARVAGIVDDAAAYAEAGEPADPELSFDLMFAGQRA